MAREPTLSVQQREAIGRMSVQLRSFDKVVRKLDTLEARAAPLDEKKHEQMWAMKARAEELTIGYAKDQGMTQAGRERKSYDVEWHRRADLQDYYDERREKMTASWNWHAMVYVAIAAAVSFIRNWSEGAWGLAAGAGASVLEFIVRNGIITYQQDSAERGWRAALKYAQMENGAFAERMGLREKEERAEDGRAEKKKGRRMGASGRIEYAD